MTNPEGGSFELDYLDLPAQAQRFLRAALESQAAHQQASQEPTAETRLAARRAQNTWARVEANTSRADQHVALAVLLRHEARPLTG